MSTLSPNSSDAGSSSDDHRPDYQSDRANDVHPNLNEPQLKAEPGTPNYGDFGKLDSPDAQTSQPTSNSGSNDNPDEFSEFRKPGAPSTEDYGTSADAASPEHQQGHIEQNQAPGEVKAAQSGDTDEQRTAWSNDDERYAGGHREATWKDSNEKEHSND